MPYGHASMLLLGEDSEATEPYNKYATFSIVAIYIWDSTVGIWQVRQSNLFGTQLSRDSIDAFCIWDSICIGTQFVLGLNLFRDSIVASPVTQWQLTQIYPIL